MRVASCACREPALNHHVTSLIRSSAPAVVRLASSSLFVFFPSLQFCPPSTQQRRGATDATPTCSSHSIVHPSRFRCHEGLERWMDWPGIGACVYLLTRYSPSHSRVHHLISVCDCFSIHKLSHVVLGVDAPFDLFWCVVRLYLGFPSHRPVLFTID